MNCDVNPPHAKGIVVGLTNTVVMSCGATFQPLIGKLLDLRISHKTSMFFMSDYQFALSVIPLCIVIAVLMLFFIKKPQKLQEA